ncbi:hypothetical protein BDP81DRAFT_164598 [Colletotrichum phormii]|uniref:Uncharacterized protein n=1 Tax=Colletotrichum phormii TaxID=359342 RepID=A0AAI9ZYG5_9PEZI|nr:uncharacterized protein BDP81DRAFT_164598 [Colletotrichum phormii]KAK1640513.1 hypothetical protein BDP81DRAFT_164598 [Colletotrichum phormii]
MNETKKYHSKHHMCGDASPVRASNIGRWSPGTRVPCNTDLPLSNSPSVIIAYSSALFYLTFDLYMRTYPSYPLGARGTILSSKRFCILLLAVKVPVVRKGGEGEARVGAVACLVYLIPRMLLCTAPTNSETSMLSLYPIFVTVPYSLLYYRPSHWMI